MFTKYLCGWWPASAHCWMTVGVIDDQFSPIKVMHTCLHCGGVKVTTVSQIDGRVCDVEYDQHDPALFRSKVSP
jgi:hypothetical protein